MMTMEYLRSLGSGSLRIAAVAIAGLLTGASASAQPTGAEALVSSPAGTFRGVVEEDTGVFRGIRYAEPPTGALRWKPPVAKTAAKHIVEATKFGPPCFQPEAPAAPQNIYYEPLAGMSEDCLSLNIWQPQGADKVPVLVWIHGGALLTGASHFDMYDGSRLAERGVVVVTLNYRLGVLGFLAHPELSGESPAGVSGNYGLLDQIEALNWIKANIAHFGGDPDNVTIAGESAGALSVMHLMGSPRAEGLFSKAVMQSPYMISSPALREPSQGHPSAESIGSWLQSELSAQDVAQLRAMAPGELTRRAAAAGYPTWVTVDGDIVPHQLVETFDRGEQAKVPVLAGFNSGEIRSLRVLLPPAPASAAAYEQTIRASYGELADVFLRIYPSDDIDKSMLETTRDALYGWSVQRIGEKQHAVGAPAYLYLFDHGYRSADKAGLHAFHGSEIPYMFGTIAQTPANWPRIPRTEAERRLSDAMVGYWASFAASGQPIAAGEAEWPRYGADEPWMVFNQRPVPANDVLSYRYELQEHVVCRRRAAGDQQWNWNIGLAAPSLPPMTGACE